MICKLFPRQTYKCNTLCHFSTFCFTAGMDYEFVTGDAVVFSPNSREAVYNLTLIPDDIFEGRDEQLTIGLRALDSRGVVISQSRLTLSIIEDDSKSCMHDHTFSFDKWLGSICHYVHISFVDLHLCAKQHATQGNVCSKEVWLLTTYCTIVQPHKVYSVLA